MKYFGGSGVWQWHELGLDNRIDVDYNIYWQI